MARKTENLSPMTIKNITDRGLHFVGHVPGLALNVSKTGSRSWILRLSIAGKRRDMGLGSFPEVSLSDAKQAAQEKRWQVREGRDPIAERQRLKADLRAEQASFITFQQATGQYCDAHEGTWRNRKHAKQWRSTLENYAFPVIGDLHVKNVELSHILKILEPIWREKTETAKRLRGRIETILDWSKARGFRTGDNPAAWRGNLNMILPAPSKVRKVKHHSALDWQFCGAFKKELEEQGGVAPRALEFVILTACRSGEARGAVWDEIDFKNKTWIIPADRMKAGKEHRIPLSDKAMMVLERQKEKHLHPHFVFPSPTGKVLSDMALTKVLRRMEKGFTVHGFRSSFRDWAGEATAYPREVIEHALAHQLKDKVEAAYARGDLFLKRRSLMQSWSDFLNTPIVSEDNVTFMNKVGSHAK